MRLVARAPAFPGGVSIFNIGSGQARTIASLLEEMRGMARRPFEVAVDPALLRPSSTDIPVVACDASRLTAATGWRPNFSIAETLGALLDEWRAEVARPST